MVKVIQVCVYALIGLSSLLCKSLSVGNRQLVQVEVDANLAKQIDSLNLDVWRRNDELWDVLVDQASLEKLELKKSPQVVIADVDALITSTKESNSRIAEADFFAAYHDYPSLLKWYSDLAASNPTLVKYVPSIGKTFEGRDVAAVHITNNNGQKKRYIYLESLIHAREWITGSTLSYIVDYIIKNATTDPVIKSYLDKIEFIVVPVVNPDGYQYTHTNDRLWRKNRSKPTSSAIGVDLNRNWPYKWGGAGSSNDPNSELYRGPSAGSELEIKAVTSYYSKFDVIGSIDFHSYGQLVLRSFGNGDPPKTSDKLLQKVGDGIAQQILKVRGTKYSSSRFAQDSGSGMSADYFFQDGTKSLGFLVELTPTGNPGFVLPPSEIIPVGKDLIPGFIYFVNQTISNPLH